MTGLTRDELCHLNRVMIEAFGGRYNEGVRNVMNPNSLDFAVDQIEAELERDSVPLAAARLAFRIIANHVFFDGNKRTGMMAALILLRLNDFHLTATEEDIKTAGFAIADGSWSVEQACSWFRGMSTQT